MPYDRTWARSVYEAYAKLCTRAQQIDACLAQLYEQRTGRKLIRKEIADVLVDAIQGKGRKKFWTDYKRLCKKTPLDVKLLERIAGELRVKVDVEKIQRQFDFT